MLFLMIGLRLLRLPLRICLTSTPLSGKECLETRSSNMSMKKICLRMTPRLSTIGMSASQKLLKPPLPHSLSKLFRLLQRNCHHLLRLLCHLLRLRFATLKFLGLPHCPWHRLCVLCRKHRPSARLAHRRSYRLNRGSPVRRVSRGRKP